MKQSAIITALLKVQKRYKNILNIFFEFILKKTKITKRAFYFLRKTEASIYNNFAQRIAPVKKLTVCL